MDRYSASQEILGSQRFFTAFTVALLPALVLSQINPIHASIPFLEDPV